MNKEEKIKKLREKTLKAKTYEEYENLHKQIQAIQRELGYKEMKKPEWR